MKVISLLNMKGGVAKSFTAVNMAYELWRRGYRVLILDNDKQGNTSRAYRRYDAESAAPAARLLTGDCAPSPEDRKLTGRMEKAGGLWESRWRIM